MAFLSSFEYDIFISYSHVDNLGDAWVNHFHEALEIALAQRVGRMGIVTIWRDRKLQGDQLFDQTIDEALTRAAIFIAITSNGYLESEYCRRELRAFWQKASTEPHGLQIGDRSRIYNVLLGNIPPARWPQQYGRVSGFAFHDADDRPGVADEEGEPTDPVYDRPRFKRQLSALASSLHRMLVAFREELAPAPAAAANAGPGEAAAETPGVFVADVADTLAQTRKRLIVELQRKGIRVEHAIPPPYEAAAHAEKVKATLADALLSVHLLDAFPGRDIEGEPHRTYTQRQIELAQECGVSRLLWVPKELDFEQVEDESYRGLLQGYEQGEREGERYDFVRGSSTLLLPQIVEKLEELRKAQAGPQGPTQAILVDTHLKDQAYALELGRLLLERSIQPFINPQEDDPTRHLDAFEARLRQVSSLVILFGAVSESWVRHRLAVALQLAVSKGLPLESFSILLVPPQKDKQLQIQLGPISVPLIDNSRSAGLDPAAMASLCQPRRAGASA
jgi:hypothetical protein